MLIMITYLLIGLAHAIIFGILLPRSFKNDWVSFKEDANNIYSEVGLDITIFSGEEAYRRFCLGLILTIIVWPIIDILWIMCIL